MEIKFNPIQSNDIDNDFPQCGKSIALLVYVKELFANPPRLLVINGMYDHGPEYKGWLIRADINDHYLLTPLDKENFEVIGWQEIPKIEVLN